MVEIKLTKNKIAIVDDKYFEYINSFNWYYDKGYAWRNGKKTGSSRYGYNTRESAISMHRFLMRLSDKNKCVDHINRNGLDNRLCNLRICSKKENTWNKGINKNNTSGYKGVYWQKEKNKWHARITKDGKVTFLGLFENKDVAAKEYNKAAKKYFGKFASLNVF